MSFKTVFSGHLEVLLNTFQNLIKHEDQPGGRSGCYVIGVACPPQGKRMLSMRLIYKDGLCDKDCLEELLFNWANYYWAELLFNWANYYWAIITHLNGVLKVFNRTSR